MAKADGQERVAAYDPEVDGVFACSRCQKPEGRPVDPEFVCRKCRSAAHVAENRWIGVP